LKGRKAIALFLVTVGISPPGWGGIFSSHGSVAISATAVVSAVNSTIQATPLPATAFFGKDVVIPVQVTSSNGTLNQQTLNVSMLYQLVDPYGVALGSAVSVPVSFGGSAAIARAPGSTILSGSAVIPVSNLEPIRHGGGLQYIFQAQQGASRTLLTMAGITQSSGTFTSLPSPFQTMIVDSICRTVGSAGGQVSAPDLFENDGHTSVALGPGAVSGQGNLCINQEDPANWPSGPGGAQPAAIYSMSLDGATLNQTATLTLSYAADPSGNVLNLHVRPEDLAMFWLGPENLPVSDQSWHVLSRASVDPTLHTLTGLTSHFSTFALFASGDANTAASTRPATRILTPNGNNRTVQFASDVNEVRIFNVKGRRIRTLNGASPVWDGRDDTGSTVESGVYIYQYTSQGERVSGVIAVAK
jgi:hypothetical protein